MQSAASDLALLADAAREAGALARALSGKPLEIESKGAAGPVTNVDFAVNNLLTERLRSARPDYGWLSEETPDDLDDRIGRARVFMLDPIDGTAALIEGIPQYTISIGVTRDDRAWLGAIYNPMTDELFLGGGGEAATLNGRPVRASARDTIEGATMIGVPGRFSAHKWPAPWPKMDIVQRHSIAYRMALVGAGMADATLLFGWKNDWDIAAGAAIVVAAGGRVTDPWGEELALNTADRRVPGLVVSGAPLHPLLIERMRTIPHPRKAGPK